MVSGLLLANAENVAASVRSGAHPNPLESVIWQAAAMPRDASVKGLSDWIDEKHGPMRHQATFLVQYPY